MNNIIVTWNLKKMLEPCFIRILVGSSKAFTLFLVAILEQGKWALPHQAHPSMVWLGMKWHSRDTFGLSSQCKISLCWSLSNMVSHLLSFVVLVDCQCPLSSPLIPPNFGMKPLCRPLFSFELSSPVSFALIYSIHHIIERSYTS